MVELNDFFIDQNYNSWFSVWVLLVDAPQEDIDKLQALAADQPYSYNRCCWEINTGLTVGS